MWWPMKIAEDTEVNKNKWPHQHKHQKYTISFFYLDLKMSEQMLYQHEIFMKEEEKEEDKWE